MRQLKLDLKKEQLECLRLLGKCMSNETPPQLSADQKHLLADFLASCIGNIRLNKMIFNHKRKLTEMGIDSTALNIVLDITFCTRNQKYFSEALNVFQGNKPYTPGDALDIIKHFAYIHNYQLLYNTLAKLQDIGVLCDGKKTLIGLYGDCGTAKKIVEEYETNAKRPGLKLGLYDKASAHNEILVLFQHIYRNFNDKPHKDVTPKI